MAKKTQRKRTPRFGGGIITDNAALAPTGKMNAYGIFTMFWAWDFPCRRHADVIITLFDIPKRKTKVTISVKKEGTRAKELASLIIKSNEVHPIPLVNNTPLTLTFSSAGNYELLCSIPQTRRTLKIAFEVRKKAWPEFTKDEIKFARANPDFIKIIRTNIHCLKCSHAYIFEENLSEIPPDGGVERFPESGKFKCKNRNCTNTLELRDLQGQLRDSLKEQIKQAMGKKP